MKIGIYGGSFNPIHRGHTEIIKYAINDLNLDKLILIPLGIASHKKDKNNTRVSKEDRYNMCVLATRDIENVEVSRIEIDSEEVSYTYDTLMKLKKLYNKSSYGEENTFYELIGSDSAEYFDSWKNYKGILNESKVVVFARKGHVNNILDENMIVLNNPYYDISSTEIREKIKNKIEVSSALDELVIKYIEENKLYI